MSNLPPSELRAGTTVRLSLGKVIAIVSSIVSCTVAITCFVVSSVHEVRDGINAHTQQFAGIAKQLERLDQKLDTQQAELRAEEQDIASRRSKLDPWRWDVAADLVDLGRASHVEIRTHYIAP